MMKREREGERERERLGVIVRWTFRECGYMHSTRQAQKQESKREIDR